MFGYDILKFLLKSNRQEIKVYNFKHWKSVHVLNCLYILMSLTFQIYFKNIIVDDNEYHLK